MRAVAEVSNFGSVVELRLYEQRGDGYSVAKLTMEHVPRGAYSEPTARMSMTDAQELIDALWRCGLRPSEGSGSAGALAATQKHLEDMRSLVFERFPKQ